ncbi:MAG: ClpXP protease specificity-enhancing factor [Gammaproteobacteria bacterium]|nr:ClpXP protease specificity-enhancing factor [Gammaproteobacteria bacterium]
MSSSRPYLLRALYDWINDNQMTAHIVVNADVDQVIVPRQFVEAGKIVLNISPSAVQGLELTNDFVSFSARFSGKAMDIFVPVYAVLAIYAKENGQGMVFSDEPGAPPPENPDDTPDDRPKLRLVK